MGALTKAAAISNAVNGVDAQALTQNPAEWLRFAAAFVTIEPPGQHHFPYTSSSTTNMPELLKPHNLQPGCLQTSASFDPCDVYQLLDSHACSDPVSQGVQRLAASTMDCNATSCATGLYAQDGR